MYLSNDLEELHCSTVPIDLIEIILLTCKKPPGKMYLDKIGLILQFNINTIINMIA